MQKVFFSNQTYFYLFPEINSSLGLGYRIENLTLLDHFCPIDKPQTLNLIFGIQIPMSKSTHKYSFKRLSKVQVKLHLLTRLFQYRCLHYLSQYRRISYRDVAMQSRYGKQNKIYNE